MKPGLKGIFAALTTPFEKSEISPGKLKENIHKYNAFDLSGYLVLGSTGESVYLSDEESEKLVQTALETASPEKVIIVGTSRESTSLTLDFIKRIASFQPDAALVRTPSYFKSKMTQDALRKHYLILADNSPVPLILYHIPQFTGVNLTGDLIGDLSRHPNIAGIKDSSGNLEFLGEVLSQVESGFSCLLGAGSVLLPGLLLGASGGILALADIVPALCARLYELFKAGKIEDAIKLQRKLIPLNQAVTRTFGVSGAKYAMDLQGYHGGLPRPPLLPLEEKEKKEIEKILKEFAWTIT